MDIASQRGDIDKISRSLRFKWERPLSGIYFALNEVNICHTDDY